MRWWHKIEPFVITVGFIVAFFAAMPWLAYGWMWYLSYKQWVFK